MKERQALANVTGGRYRKAAKRKKGEILQEFCQSTGYHRKYAITLLRNAGKTQLRRIGKETVRVNITATTHRKRVYTRFYDDKVEQAVISIWDFFRRVCGTRLVPMIRANLPALADKFSIPQDVQAKLATVSRSTVERMLRRERKAHTPKGTCSTKPGTLLKHQIPVRTFWRWDDKQPGFCEIDTVSHDGGYAAGEYAFTLSLTDVALCWSEFRALKNKARKWTQEALEDIRAAFPVPLKGIDSDNGGEFINWHLKGWCETRRITFTRGRQYHKNDNAYVEQKNGDIVRKTVGYARFQGDSALSALSSVYAVLNPLMNFFYPNMKCIDKLQVGQQKKRVYEKELKTPFQRIMERPDISENIKQSLWEKKDALDIIGLQESLNAALDNLDRLAHHAPGR
ncbi:MAG: transposase [Treponema sp.]|jgi:hypothetical protein|nr:transposase [Treponema sp.]